MQPDALRQQLRKLWEREGGASDWNSITGKPTTIVGFGITDGITLTSSALPPTGTGTVGLFHIDTAANKLYWGQGSAWYFVTGGLYTPAGGTPGQWDFANPAQSGHLVTAGF